MKRINGQSGKKSKEEIFKGIFTTFFKTMEEYKALRRLHLVEPSEKVSEQAGKKADTGTCPDLHD